MDKNFKVIQYGLIENQEQYFEKILKWCETESKDSSTPAAINMRIDDWQTNEDTLAYILHNKRRFYKRGEYFFLEVDDQIVASAGIYRSDFDNQVAIGGARSWANADYRAQFVIGRYLLPLQLKWAKANGFKTIVLTFNEYNARLVNHFKRSGLGIVKKRNPDSFFYNGVFEVPHPIMIKSTKQWAIYHKIDEEYEPNWSLIKAD